MHTTEQKPDKAPNHSKKIVLHNRRARHEYFIEDIFEAGLQLVGTEVKSIRAGQANLQDAFCRVEHGEVWLFNMHISPFDHGTHWNVEPTRKRKLLLHRREIDIVQAKMEQKGLALIPLALFFQHGFAKVEIGIGKGKKLFDKRDSIAKRDQERDERRSVFGRD
ncbi:MAG: SsrA-binding protein SmpB [Chthonomonadales bacterium]